MKRVLILGLLIAGAPAGASYKMGTDKPVKVKKTKAEPAAATTKEPTTAASAPKPDVPANEEKEIEQAKSKAKPHKKQNMTPFEGEPSGPAAPNIPAATETQAVFGVANRFGVPVDRVQYLRNLRWGFEDIVRALIVARDAQTEPGRVLQKRLEGDSWERIADGFFVQATDVEREAREILVPMRKTLPTSVMNDRPRQMDADGHD